MEDIDTTVPPSQPAGRAQPQQVRVYLSTQEEDLQIPESIRTVLVSTQLRRIQLSTLVNSLLEREQAVPFEFLINGHFLRTSIDKFLTNHGISAEGTLSVEYVRSTVPPSAAFSLPADDWISSVDVSSSSSQFPVSSSQTSILSGSFDGILRIWNKSVDLIAQSEPLTRGPTAAIKSARFISPSKIVASSMDRTVRVWEFKRSEDDSNPLAKGELVPQLELYGHTSSVDALAVSTDGSRILSASADGRVGLWTVDKNGAPAALPSLVPIETSHKRRKNGSESRAQTSSIPKRGPLGLLAGHVGPVTSVIFSPSSPAVAYSVSADSTVRTWDLLMASDSPVSAAVSCRTVTSPLLSICALSTLGLLAAGTSDRTIVLIDPREGATHTVAKTLKGHTNWVTSLAASPMSEYGIASSSYDGTVRIWDIRGDGGAATDSKAPVSSAFVIQRESATTGPTAAKASGLGPKLFDLCWDHEVGLVCGGDDHKVQVNHWAP